jgi:D-sedoheptulose 7-phosphate isomerase
MFREYYDDYKKQFLDTIERLDYNIIERVLTIIEDARAQGRQVFVMGNGGSASSASHWACDFGKGINTDRSVRLRIASLTDNTAWLTALGNDLAYADIFAEQLKNVLNAGDVVIGLSVSGDSDNVVNAFRYARERGAAVIALVGAKRGRMAELADLALIIPSEDYGIVEDVHMFVNHVISQHIKQLNLQKIQGA